MLLLLLLFCLFVFKWRKPKYLHAERANGRDREGTGSDNLGEAWGDNFYMETDLNTRLGKKDTSSWGWGLWVSRPQGRSGMGRWKLKEQVPLSSMLAKKREHLWRTGGKGSRAEEGLVETDSLGRDTEGMGEPSEKTVQRHSGHSWECAPQISNWANPRKEGHMSWKAQDNEGPAIRVRMKVGRARATKGAVLGRMETGCSQLLLRNVIPFNNITRKKCPTNVSIYQNPLVSSLAQPSLFNYQHCELANSLYFWRPYICVFCPDLVEKVTKEDMRLKKYWRQQGTEEEVWGMTKSHPPKIKSHVLAYSQVILVSPILAVRGTERKWHRHGIAQTQWALLEGC